MEKPLAGTIFINTSGLKFAFYAVMNIQAICQGLGFADEPFDVKTFV